MRSLLNLDTITTEAYIKLKELDEKFIGTYNYLGIGWFWNYEFRHYLRDASINERKKVHNIFLTYNLNVSDATELHYQIIKETLKTN